MPLRSTHDIAAIYARLTDKALPKRGIGRLERDALVREGDPHYEAIHEAEPQLVELARQAALNP